MPVACSLGSGTPMERILGLTYSPALLADSRVSSPAAEATSLPAVFAASRNGRALPPCFLPCMKPAL